MPKVNCTRAKLRPLFLFKKEKLNSIQRSQSQTQLKKFTQAQTNNSQNSTQDGLTRSKILTTPIN